MSGRSVWVFQKNVCVGGFHNNARQPDITETPSFSPFYVLAILAFAS